MSADIIPLRPARPIPTSPLGETPIEAKLAEACSDEMFDRRERAIVDTMAQGDLRRAIIHFSALVAMNINPFTAKALEAARDGRLAALLDHIEQAARRHSRDIADKDAP
jgi:hypothetical protein